MASPSQPQPIRIARLGTRRTAPAKAVKQSACALQLCHLPALGLTATKTYHSRPVLPHPIHSLFESTPPMALPFFYRPARRALATTGAAMALCAAAATGALAAQPAAAAALPDKVLQQPNVSLALANELVNATLAACQAEGRSAVAVVVDRGGNLIALQRGDSVGPHNTEAAVRKAFTALSTKSLTRQLATNARANPDSQNLNTVGSLLLIGGGVPLRIGADVIGALGVGGAGGAAQDEGCALQAIAKVLPAATPVPAH